MWILIIGEADSVYWAASEVERLIQGWEQHADAVNLARNESVMQNIADIVGTGKSAKQVRMKVSIWVLSGVIMPHIIPDFAAAAHTLYVTLSSVMNLVLLIELSGLFSNVTE